MMLTRSQTKQLNNKTEFDFDESSKKWNENKIKLSNGCYKYKNVVTLEIDTSVKRHRYNTRLNSKNKV